MRLSDRPTLRNARPTGCISRSQKMTSLISTDMHSFLIGPSDRSRHNANLNSIEQSPQRAVTPRTESAICALCRELVRRKITVGLLYVTITSYHEPTLIAVAKSRTSVSSR